MTGEQNQQRGHQTSERAVRTFVCIEIPGQLKVRIGELQDTLRKVDAQISWVRPSNVHLTLKFLGNVAAQRISSVCQAVERATRARKSFDIAVGGAGCFPSPGNPRVFWVGLDNAPEPLSRLQTAIEDELALEGFERDVRRFSPHLTIGRVRAPQGARGVARALMDAGFAVESFTATEVIVMRSDLNPSGSIYTPLARLALRER